MLFPLYDDTRPEITPWVTRLLVMANVLVWIFVQGMGFEPAMAKSLCRFAYIPGDVLGLVNHGEAFWLSRDMYCVLSGDGSLSTVITSMFMHGGWLHLIGNMWFLWIFGDNVEDALGHTKFLLFYLVCGVAGALAQTIINPASIIPMVGASGAISGVMGAYLLLYPRARVKSFLFIIVFFTVLTVPAVILIGLWFLQQLLMGVGSIGESAGGVAYMAHVGGFVMGLGLAKFLKTRKRVVARIRTVDWR